MPRPKLVIGRASWEPRPKFPLMRSIFSSGASGKPMEAAWLATSSCTCSAELTSLPGQMVPREPWQPEDCASGKTGETLPDVMLGLFDYREGFNLSLRVNFVDGGEESEGLIFTGSEGPLEIAGNTLTLGSK